MSHAFTRSRLRCPSTFGLAAETDSYSDSDSGSDSDSSNSSGSCGCAALLRGHYYIKDKHVASGHACLVFFCTSSSAAAADGKLARRSSIGCHQHQHHHYHHRYRAATARS